MLTSPEETIEINMPRVFRPESPWQRICRAPTCLPKQTVQQAVKAYPDAIQMGAVITRVKISDLKRTLSPGCTKRWKRPVEIKARLPGEGKQQVDAPKIGCFGVSSQPGA